MRRRYVLIALASVALVALAMPAFGAPSPVNVAKKALKSAKKANKKANAATRRSKRAMARANAATGAAQAAGVAGDQALGLINSAGGVPRAASAANADKAAGADNAAMAAQLAGFTRVDKLTRLTATAGATYDIARNAAPETPLGTSGPFTFYGKCLMDNSAPELLAEIYARTSVDGAIFDGQDDQADGDPAFFDTGTIETSRVVESLSVFDNNEANIDMDEETSGFVTPDLELHQVQVFTAAKRGNLAAGNGLYGDGDVCLLGLQLLR